MDAYCLYSGIYGALLNGKEGSIYVLHFILKNGIQIETQKHLIFILRITILQVQ